MGLNGLSKEYILMSIKPHYADLIYTERKRFEYRKRAPKLVDLPILLYETAPVQSDRYYRRLVDTTGISGGRVDVFEDPQRLDG